ncbi:M20 family metallopeptidase [Sporosarcina sp. ANT_H38]|uniref:Sapep family Mn(2+)-dependent dipeptidase n=1 Tax=Sporosarcina sp. ANT_H38 TaxID=2597358 RepID=UPI0011F3030C|nr:Sapep family Mn(2+)-dependent dipeptidase [Sporosarcina sp. ANT_H38]KAA0966374.1 M20 family metallopeptidase [Sporosarcina sp. ANT_H38]
MGNLIDSYYERLRYYEEQLMDDLAELVAIRSVRDLESKDSNSPFGMGIRDAFDKMISFAERDSFINVDFDGYALHIESGQGEEVIGILAHLDIVPEGEKDDWSFDPFILTNHDGFLYGRGVNDDKAPALASYYAMKILRDLGFVFNRKVRLILGGAEETSWECMDHYFKYNPQPIMAFSPDGDFPIVNGEKGVIQGSFYLKDDELPIKESQHDLLVIESEKQRGFICENLIVKFHSHNPNSLKDILIEAAEVHCDNEIVTAIYRGEKTLSRNPHKGANAIFKFGRDLMCIEGGIGKGRNFKGLLERFLLDDVHGEKMGLYDEDSEMGETTLSIPYVLYKGREFEIAFDYRFPKSRTQENVQNKLTEFSVINCLSLEISKVHQPLYVHPDSELITTLQQAYKRVTGENAELMTKGGISYARALNCGVAFGPSFQGDTPNTHKQNEKIRIETLYKAIIIYCETLRLLATR